MYAVGFAALLPAAMVLAVSWRAPSSPAARPAAPVGGGYLLTIVALRASTTFPALSYPRYLFPALFPLLLLVLLRERLVGWRWAWLAGALNRRQRGASRSRHAHRPTSESDWRPPSARPGAAAGRQRGGKPRGAKSRRLFSKPIRLYWQRGWTCPCLDDHPDELAAHTHDIHRRGCWRLNIPRVQSYRVTGPLERG